MLTMAGQEGDAGGRQVRTPVDTLSVSLNTTQSWRA
jgi:hypothetical protein